MTTPLSSSENWEVTGNEAGCQCCCSLSMLSTEIINNTNKYKEQLKIAEVSRDGRIEKYTNKSGRDYNRQDASLHVFS